MKIIGISIPMMIIIGLILEFFEVGKANIITGVGVLGVMFVLIPFFLFWRYDKKQKRKAIEEKQNNF